MKKLTSLKLKNLSLAITLAGSVLSLASSWVDDKKMDEKVHKEVVECLKKEREA